MNIVAWGDLTLTSSHELRAVCALCAEDLIYMEVTELMSEQANIYAEVPGGLELLAYFGRVPAFGDAEVISLHLDRDGPSILRVHGWVIGDRTGDAYGLERHAVVTFTIDGVMDLQLDGFSIQNVIGGLTLRRAPDRLERRGYLALPPLSQDIEIELEPCYGLNGLIRGRSLSISLEPGKPDAKET